MKLKLRDGCFNSMMIPAEEKHREEYMKSIIGFVICTLLLILLG
jgi:hypothetical protein